MKIWWNIDAIWFQIQMVYREFGHKTLMKNEPLISIERDLILDYYCL